MGNSCGGSCGTEQKSTCGSPDAALAQQDLAINRSLGRIKNKILVMSGKGGVGKSTVAVNLALGLANRGYQVGLMDVDLHGPDICRMLSLTGSMEPPKNPADLVPPLVYNDNLKVVSLEYMMQNRDDPIIWRGPLKIQAIRQFIADMDWGELDYLVIDSPPGTGDEPLSVAQTVNGVEAVIVTTPQAVALADVRKSINFCKSVKMPIAGVVENMSGFICPHCHEAVDIFSSGGGEQTARDFDLPFLGRVPMDPRVVIAGDTGRPYLSTDEDTPAVTVFNSIIDAVEKRLPATAAAGLETLDALNSSCACGPSGCDPGKCSC
ncbi:Cytosolic Fe-S cluster assembling factor NBP35 [hydrothermal vent metagenome]|uniref:Cytosolic Fe-S cluster assembling factor NBP35 n=1 Tax=hydrothermal vent metagenome TaxID=652676 RepID=A0A3B0VN13_9ZZZZ